MKPPWLSPHSHPPPTSHKPSIPLNQLTRVLRVPYFTNSTDSAPTPTHNHQAGVGLGEGDLEDLLLGLGLDEATGKVDANEVMQVTNASKE